MELSQPGAIDIPRNVDTAALNKTLLYRVHFSAYVRNTFYHEAVKVVYTELA